MYSVEVHENSSTACEKNKNNYRSGAERLSAIDFFAHVCSLRILNMCFASIDSEVARNIKKIHDHLARVLYNLKVNGSSCAIQPDYYSCLYWKFAAWSGIAPKITVQKLFLLSLRIGRSPILRENYFDVELSVNLWNEKT